MAGTDLTPPVERRSGPTDLTDTESGPERGPAVRPIVPAALTSELAERAQLLVPGALAGGVAVRIGIDAADDRDGATLADAVAEQLSATGRAVVRVSAGDFLFRRSVRLEYGAADVDAAYQRTIDAAGLSREVLDPLADPGRMQWLPRLWDAPADRPARERPRPAVPGTVAVVDGPYLLRWELSGGFDLVVHLSLAPATLRRRFGVAEDPRPAAWARYLDDCDPAGRADLVVKYDHPLRPAVLRAG